MSTMLIASHRTCFPDLDRLSQFVPQLTLPFSPTAILFSHSLLLYDIDFIHNSLPPILGRASVGVREFVHKVSIFELSVSWGLGQNNKLPRRLQL